jgi:exopolysaccharide biosynthesis polyprenyl glycosylphosphotransferase
VGTKSLQRKVLLLVVDALLITGAELLAIILFARDGYFNEFVIGRTWFFVLPILVNLLAVYFVQGYHLEEIVTPWRGLAAMTIASTVAGVATGFLFFVIPSAPEFSAKVLLASAVIIAVLLWVARVIYGRVLAQPGLKENLLIIGTGESAARLAEVIQNRLRSPYRVVALLENTLSSAPATSSVALPADVRVIHLEELPTLLNETSIDTIVLGMRGKTEDRLVRAIVELKRRGMKVTELTDLYEELTGMTPVKYVGEMKMLFQNFGQRSEFARFTEEVFNRGLALILLALSSPLWPFIILGQQLNSRGPVFVERSNRVGVSGQVFRFYKFRSMVPGATAKGKGLITGSNDPRVTAFGRILRKTHLDEVPQLLNILKGDMNFIGPRAEYEENVQRLEEKIPFYHERHMIKPGMTGWAQVRNIYTDASEKGTMEKIQYDLYYLKHRSLALDLAIIIRTIKLILKGKGTA